MNEGRLLEILETKGSEIEQVQRPWGSSVSKDWKEGRWGWGGAHRESGGDEVRRVCTENTPPPIFKISVL